MTISLSNIKFGDTVAAIKRTKLADSVIEEIKRRLLSGELKEGDKLPNQAEFAIQLGVSRPSLREALHTLSLVGAIEQRPGFGTVIRARIPILYANHISPPLMSDHQATLELINYRRYIEVGMVELAVKNATENDILKLESTVVRMRDALDKGKTDVYVESDVAFHFSLAEASHNRFILHQIVNIRGFLEQFMQESFGVLPGMFERSFKFHVDIFNTIKRRNVKEARSSMDKHIQDIQNGLERYYKLASAKQKDDLATADNYEN
jgi:GntR family transcriptional repressor for pyruvate dehydrogenase complex